MYTTSDGLVADQYHLDSAYVAWREGIAGRATFDLYTRTLPFGGAYLLAAGLELAVDFARRFSFTDEDLAWLQRHRGYPPEFLRHLKTTRFTGDVHAMPEGEIAFADEPLLRVDGPFAEALLLEAGLLHLISVSTLLATKAARMVTAADGRPVAEFALRRAQEPFLVARSAAVGGCASTSFLGAAKVLGLTSSGTIPHALVQAFDDEEAAFRAVAATLPRYTLLLDTYDVEQAIETAISVAKDAEQQHGHILEAVRLDSGDLVAQSRLVRRMLDTAGMSDVRILASGDLDEHRIGDLVGQDAPIDAFGVGTSLGVGAGGPAGSRAEGGALGAVYKLVWYEGRTDPAVIKTAGSKSTWPGRKQVYRVGDFGHDLIAEESEAPPGDAVPLLVPVVRGGTPVPEVLPDLDEIREHARGQLEALPAVHRRISKPRPYPVHHSEHLLDLRLEHGGPGDADSTARAS